LSRRRAIRAAQTIYLAWAFDEWRQMPTTALRASGGLLARGDVSSTYTGVNVDDRAFWWSQYLWLSVLPAAAYACDAALQVVPWLTTLFCTTLSGASGARRGGGANGRRSESCCARVRTECAALVGVVTQIFVPVSRLFVGKHMHEPMSHVVRYFFFWGTLISFKLAFGYLYIVSPMVTPSIAMYDEYMNFPEVLPWTTQNNNNNKRRVQPVVGHNCVSYHNTISVRMRSIDPATVSLARSSARSSERESGVRSGVASARKEKRGASDAALRPEDDGALLQVKREGSLTR
jgi:hypothetical protein